MYRFKPIFLISIHGKLAEEKISTEEATLQVAKEHFTDILHDVSLAKSLIAHYEKEKMMQKRKEIITIPATGKKIVIPVYPPKDKAAYNLFLRFYRAAKRDLKSKGRISEKTLAMIK